MPQFRILAMNTILSLKYLHSHPLWNQSREVTVKKAVERVTKILGR